MFTLLHNWLINRLNSFPFLSFILLIAMLNENLSQKSSNSVLNWILFGNKELKQATHQTLNTLK